MATVTRPETPNDLNEVADFQPGAVQDYARQTAVYVYEAPVRIWHWVNALLIIILCVTGYLIGSPLHSVGGEPSDSFLFGNIRFVHFAAGQTLAVFFLFRAIWALFGNHQSCQLFCVPFWRGRWWREGIFEARLYSFLERDPKKFIGHNRLAQLAMFTAFLLPLIFMIVTGFAFYAEWAGQGTWWYAAFGWVLVFTGNSMALHTPHHLGVWVITCFATIHIYAAVREDIMSRQLMLSSMVSGWRMFKDDEN